MHTLRSRTRVLIISSDEIYPQTPRHQLIQRVVHAVSEDVKDFGWDRVSKVLYSAFLCVEHIYIISPTTARHAFNRSATPHLRPMPSNPPHQISHTPGPMLTKSIVFRSLNRPRLAHSGAMSSSVSFGCCVRCELHVRDALPQDFVLQRKGRNVKTAFGMFRQGHEDHGKVALERV
jgi:hypothetical protein